MRNSAPDAAFAFITTIDGEKHRLLKHHNNKVSDGNDNDTVDVELLKCALNIVDQLPASAEEKDNIRIHLESHAATVNTGPQPDDIRDPQHDHGTRQQLEKDERAAREIVGAQNSGPAGNQNITDPRIDERLVDEPPVTRRAEEQLRQEGGKGSIVGGGSTPVAPGQDNSPSNTSGDVTHEQDDDPKTDVETVSPGGKGPSDSLVSGDAATADPGADVVHEDSLGKPGPDPKAGVPQSGTKRSVAIKDEKTTSRGKSPITGMPVKQPRQATSGPGKDEKKKISPTV